MPQDPTDDSVFPAPVYNRTVLAPLFEHSKRHYASDLMAINRAHAVMLAETGVLAKPQAATIVEALRDVEEGLDPNDLSYTGEVEDFFFFVEEELKGRLGPDLAGRLHTGRSRNDIDHTVFKLALMRRLDDLTGRVCALVDTAIDVADRESGTLIVAYTHGQPAQPSTFGHYLGALIEVLLRDLDRLAQARDTVDRCSMGAAAITTTGFPIDRHRVADLLGFKQVQENAYGCIAACDYITAPYSAMKLLFVNLGRFAQDMAQWAAFEVRQLHVPDAYVQISSIMPQKRNPVPLEHLRLLCSLAAGHCDGVIDVMRNTPFTDMNDSEAEVQTAGYEAFEKGGRALDLFDGLLGAVSIDEGRVRRNIQAGCITITELADTLVRREGLSFRQAHEIAAAVARAVVGAAGTLEESGFAPFRQAFEATVGRTPGLDENAYRQAVSAEHFVAVRDRFGGPAPAALQAALKRYRAALNGHNGALKDREARRAAASQSLEAASRALAESRMNDGGD